MPPYQRETLRGGPSALRMLANRLMAWRRPSTKVVLRRLHPYLLSDIGVAPGECPASVVMPAFPCRLGQTGTSTGVPSAGWSGLDGTTGGADAWMGPVEESFLLSGAGCAARLPRARCASRHNLAMRLYSRMASSTGDNPASARASMSPRVREITAW